MHGCEIASDNESSYRSFRNKFQMAFIYFPSVPIYRLHLGMENGTYEWLTEITNYDWWKSFQHEINLARKFY